VLELPIASKLPAVQLPVLLHQMMTLIGKTTDIKQEDQETVMMIHNKQMQISVQSL